MGWSFRVGRLAGIDIFVHFTFLLLVGGLTAWGYLATGDVGVALATLLLIGAVFFSVVLHELGHALAARYYGIPTRDITLLPIGGVARLERMPDRPAQELVVALAGPAVNVGLAGLLWAVGAVHAIADPERALTWGGSFVDQLWLVNIILAVFNLLPAFPMDGGRVLRAVLSMRVGPARATTVAARIGQGMAVVFFAVGLMLAWVVGNPMLLLVAVFVWFGARAEALAVRVRTGLAGVPIVAVMEREFATVDPDDTLYAVTRYARHGFQQDFPVVVAGRLIGLLSRTDLRHGLSRLGPDGRVFQAARRHFPTLSPDAPAEAGLALLAAGHPVLPVLYYGRVVGLLTAENVSEYLWDHRFDQTERPVRTRHPEARSGV